jgi:hypothetical protein
VKFVDAINDSTHQKKNECKKNECKKHDRRFGPASDRSKPKSKAKLGNDQYNHLVSVIACRGLGHHARVEVLRQQGVLCREKGHHAYLHADLLPELVAGRCGNKAKRVLLCLPDVLANVPNSEKLKKFLEGELKHPESKLKQILTCSWQRGLTQAIHHKEERIRRRAQIEGFGSSSRKGFPRPPLHTVRHRG